MPKEPHLRIGPALFYHPRQKREVIILHENDGLLHVLNFREKRLGEFPVDAFVRRPVFFPEYGAFVKELVVGEGEERGRICESAHRL